MYIHFLREKLEPPKPQPPPPPPQMFKNETKYENKSNENVDSQSNRKQKVNPIQLG